MRITLTGASGVGKTTLAQQLAHRLELPLIPELARVLCKERGFQRIGEISNQEQFKLDVLQRQIDTEETLQNFVADRSAVDCWILWQRWNICSAMTYDTENVYRMSSQQALKYTHIIYIPPLIVPVEDEFRWTDPDYTKQIDRIVRMTLYEQELLQKTLTITKITVDDRIEEVLSWIA